MKRIVFAIAFALLIFSSCKNEEKAERQEIDAEVTQDSSAVTVSGEFLYMADAAVLNTGSTVYGVVIDEKMHELDAQVKSWKKEAYDMVPVTVRGTISPKPAGEEGWPEWLTIQEIVSVSPPVANDDTIIIKSEE